MTAYILETKGLTKQIKGQKIVDHLSLKIKANSIYGLLGPNGAGKSTTLKMLTGLMYKSSGKILFDGHSWSRADLSNIGALIETPPLYENLSAWENLKVRTLLLGLPDTRIDEVLALVDLTKTGRKKSGSFSLGMKQRLGIALALLNHPQLLILDEPTNGLDPSGIKKFRSLLTSLTQQGVTIIISSHILSEVAQLVTEIGIINQGKLKYQGSLPLDMGLEQFFMDIIKED